MLSASLFWGEAVRFCGLSGIAEVKSIVSEKHLTGNTFSLFTELVHVAAQGEMTSVGVSCRHGLQVFFISISLKQNNILAIIQSTLGWFFRIIFPTRKHLIKVGLT